MVRGVGPSSGSCLRFGFAVVALAAQLFGSGSSEVTQFLSLDLNRWIRNRAGCRMHGTL